MVMPIAIEQSANGVIERILLIVAFHQEAVKSGDAPRSEMTRALHELRQKRKHRRRVAFRRGRFAGGKKAGELREQIRAFTAAACPAALASAGQEDR